MLFLDDEENILRSLKRLCRSESFDTRFCTNPDEALDLVEREGFAVIVTDMRMPIMDGITFLRKALAIDSDSVRIVLTGYSDIEAAKAAVNEGNIFKYLNKPWDGKQLLANINEAVAYFNAKTARRRDLMKLGEFMSQMVHDIRNPIHGIRGSAELLKDYIGEQTAKEFCEIIINQTGRLNEMATELLVAYKEQNPHAPKERSAVDLQSFFLEWEQLWQQPLSERSVDMTLGVGVDCTLGLSINDFSRVLNNLITNALEIEAVDHIRVTVKVEDQGLAAVQFVDNGGGIPASVRSRIFDIFFTHGKENGTGLGLSNAKKIVEKHNGRMFVQNVDWEHGRGAAFTIMLPYISAV